MERARSLFTRRTVWVVLVALALSAVGLTIYETRKTYPLVSTDLRMTRADALAKARSLEGRLKLGPKGYEQAASFYGDGSETYVQSYIEQKVGGDVAFRALIDSEDYYPITWSVRHFKPKDEAETEFEFTPKGDLYGFWVSLSEHARGAALEKAEAVKIAEAGAREFGLNPGRYRLENSDRYEAESGRADWTFDYKRADPRLKDARFALTLYVNGDDFAGYYQTVEVPKSFISAQGRLDDARTVILGTVWAVANLMFVVGGGFGLLMLARRRQFEWRKAIGWGAVVAAVSAIGDLNDLPVNWFDYTSYDSKATFLFQEVTNALTTFLGMWAIVATTLLVAEGLTRQAFPRQIQLWRIWKGETASSAATLGRTAGGYLWAAILLGYTTAFYLLMTKLFSWYAPASPTADPDMLATYLPMLRPLRISLEAAVLEEALFRALPLAGAVMLGNRFGHRKLFVGLGLVTSAVVFAGGHVGYPTEPVYTRLVELFLPAVIMGAIYLAFGLVPVIIAHFAYDYALTGLPLFTTQHSPLAAKISFVLTGLAPLLFVVVARLRAGRWTNVPAQDLNSGWVPRTLRLSQTEGIAAPSPMGRRAGAILISMCLVGATGWAATTQLERDAPALEITSDQAEQRAADHLARQGVQLSHFRATTELLEQDYASDFVIQKYGVAVYRSLLGSYLHGPGWSVEFARRDRNSQDRAEHYLVSVDHRGKVGEVAHHGAHDARTANPTPTRAQAVEAGLKAIHEKFQIGLIKQDLLSAEKEDGDWFLEFQVPGSPLKDGEARISVDLAGSELHAYRYVSVPESYYSDTDDAYSQATLLNGLFGPVKGFLLGVLGLYGVYALTRRLISKKVFLAAAATVLIFNTATSINDWQTLTEGAEGAMRAVGFILLAVLWSAGLALGIGVLNGAAAGLTRGQPKIGIVKNWMMGIPLGAFFAGAVLPAFEAFGPTTASRPDYSALDTKLPALAGLDGITAMLAGAGVLAVTFGLANHYTGNWTRNRLRGAMALAAVSAVAVLQGAVDTPLGPAVAALLLAAGAVISAIILFRRSLAAAIPAATTASILKAVSVGAAPAFPGSRAVVVIGCAATAVCALFFSWLIARPLPETFGKRRSRIDFNTIWRTRAWADPFALQLPAIENRLVGQVRSITKAGRRARVTPCRLVMKDGTVHDRVYLAEASSYLTAFGEWPQPDWFPTLDIDAVERIEPSPYRLPAWMGRRVFRKSRLTGGQCFFILKLRDGRTLHCSTPTLADFIELPPGVTGEDVVALRPDRKPKSWIERLQPAPHAWCLYRDPNLLYPDAQEPAVWPTALASPKSA